jgi:energy-coupling factor transport system ATP-binding protein
MTDDEVIDVRKKVGMIFQNPDDQIVATIVEEDVAFGPENLGIEQSEIRRRVYSALDAVSMREYARHAPHKLSGGQKQRVAIAGVLAMMPECIIFDEATAMLDPIGRKDVMELVKKIHSENITVLFITHNMDEAAEADRIIVLDKGELFLEGTPSEIFSKPEALYSVGLEVPIPTEIAGMLKNEGILDKSDLLTEEECAEEILKALGVK